MLQITSERKREGDGVASSRGLRHSHVISGELRGILWADGILLSMTNVPSAQFPPTLTVPM